MHTDKKYSYFVAEDEPLIRKNLIKKIEALQLPLILAGEASNGLDAISMIDQSCPDLVITDIKMPQCDGLQLADYLRRNHPGIKTVILSGFDDFSYAQSALKFGVRDYLLKPVKPEELMESLRSVLITLGAEAEALEPADSTRLDQESIYKLLVAYLQEHYHQDISLQELADHFGFTQEYLGKVYKKYANETMLKYITRLRMNEAKRLLLQNPEMEIQKVGEIAGYRDGYYFSRAFKAYTGMQPSEYRNMNRNPFIPE